MKLHQAWKDELIELVNTTNSLTLTESDVDFVILDHDGGSSALAVTIQPAEGSPYFNSKTLIYTARDFAKLFLGIPLQFTVNGDTTVGDIVAQISSRYGIPFDTDIDFVAEDLATPITFEESGMQDYQVDAADTSMVWSGTLSFTVANDTLDLVTIIVNADLTSLTYLQADTTLGSLDLVSSGFAHDTRQRAVNWVSGESGVSVAELTTWVNAMVKGGDIKQIDADQILAAFTDDPVPCTAKSGVGTVTAVSTTDNLVGQLYFNYVTIPPA